MTKRMLRPLISRRLISPPPIRRAQERRWEIRLAAGPPGGAVLGVLVATGRHRAGPLRFEAVATGMASFEVEPSRARSGGASARWRTARLRIAAQVRDRLEDRIAAERRSRLHLVPPLGETRLATSPVRRTVGL